MTFVYGVPRIGDQGQRSLLQLFEHDPILDIRVALDRRLAVTADGQATWVCSISATLALKYMKEIQRGPTKLYGTWFASLRAGREGTAMSLVRLLGFRTLTCGCVIGRYRELATSREVTYVEEKGGTCQSHSHRRNHTITERTPSAGTLTRAS